MIDKLVEFDPDDKNELFPARNRHINNRNRLQDTSRVTPSPSLINKNHLQDKDTSRVTPPPSLLEMTTQIEQKLRKSYEKRMTMPIDNELQRA